MAHSHIGQNFPNSQFLVQVGRLLITTKKVFTNLSARPSIYTLVHRPIIQLRLLQHGGQRQFNQPLQAFAKHQFKKEQGLRIT